MRKRKEAETIVPKMPPNCLKAGVVVGDGGEDRLLGDDDADADGDDDRGVAEREEVPEGKRTWLVSAVALVHGLAGRVVDRRDVVGVEGVPQAKGIGEDAHADSEASVVRRARRRR